MKVTVSIRSMKESDIGDVRAVAHASWHASYDGIIPVAIQNQFLTTAYGEVMMRRRLEHAAMFVAEAASGTVGFANFSRVRNDGTAELAAIYLLPNYQGLGIGTALLRAGIERLAGAHELTAQVERDNASGRAFYEARGFETKDEFDENFEGHILRTVRMTLQL